MANWLLSAEGCSLVVRFQSIDTIGPFVDTRGSLHASGRIEFAPTGEALFRKRTISAGIERWKYVVKIIKYFKGELSCKPVISRE